MKRPQKSYRAGAVYLHSGLTDHGDGDRRYFVGAVPTMHGYVSVYAEAKYANWRFIYHGEQHDLTVRRTFTQRGLVTVARRFADDVANGREVIA